MRFHPTALKQSGLFLLLATGLVRGQAADSPIVFQSPSAITETMVAPPNVGGDSGGGGGDNGQWLKIEFHYAVTPKAPLQFLDAVEFRIWVEGRDLYAADATTAQGIAVGLTGTVTYVNLAATHDAYGVFYVHPSALARYSTKEGAADFDRKFNVHIEAYVGGAKMDYFDKNKEQDPNWYKSLREIPGIVSRQDQSPFILADAMRYPEIKLSNPTAP